MRDTKNNPWRPTKYLGNETLEKAWYYYEHFEECGDVIPSTCGLARYLGVDRSQVFRWSKLDSRKDFRNILDIIQTKQEVVLMNKGLTGDFNANIAKLALGKHGYSDKADNTHCGPNGGPIETKAAVITKEMSPEEAAAIYYELMG